MERAAQNAIALDEPRREHTDGLTLVGLSRRYGYRDVGAIPAQWTDFQPYEGTLGERRGLWYGLCDKFNEVEGTFRYTVAVEVGDPREVPEGLEIIRLPTQTYLAFRHKGHISELRHTMDAIWGQYMPTSPCKADGDQPLFELYDEKFDARTGRGGLEIWIPVKT